ncbi:MAG: SGNH/GDSL hydrolase family protein [Phycisphaerae bacterium]
MTGGEAGAIAQTAPASAPASRAALTPIRHSPPRVLVFGDSICVYYFPFVKDLLKDKATIVHGGHTVGTRYVKENLDKILKTGGGDWDVIHFNCGLHDVKDHKVVPIDEYEKNLREIVTRLKAANARLVWGTTTPVGGHSNGNAGDRQDKDVAEYNAVARKIMEENGIPMDDLYAVAKPKIADIQKNDGVHFEDEGSKLLARSVADSILSAISARGTATAPK